MDLIRFETGLEFSEESILNTPAGSIFQALTKQKSPKEGRPEEPGVRIRDEKEKILVLWRYESCTVVFEDRKGKECIKGTLDILNKIDEAAEIGKLKKATLTTYWILPVKKYDFKKLESKYRGSFIREYDMFRNCVDSSVIVDLKYDNGVMHHQSGAMDIEQLNRDFRTFKLPESENKLFIFLLTRMSSTDVVKYSREKIGQFLTWSFEQCECHARDFDKIMEGII